MTRNRAWGEHMNTQIRELESLTREELIEPIQQEREAIGAAGVSLMSDAKGAEIARLRGAIQTTYQRKLRYACLKSDVCARRNREEVVSKRDLLLLIASTYIANGMPPVVAALVGIVFAAWAFWEARKS